MMFALYVCNICLKSESVSSATLDGCERFLALKLIRKDKIHILRSPLTVCQLCYKKLQFFKYKIFVKIKLKALAKLTNKQKMQYSNYSPKMEENTFNFDSLIEDEAIPNQYFDLKLPTTETDEYIFPLQDQTITENKHAEQPCINDYDCKCESCQNKYGDLPILLQGIEQKSSIEKTDPQPSTSSQSNSSKRILSCEYCKKTFTHKGDFNKHLRKHTKEKPFSCSICNKKFGHTSNLNRHKRLHSGLKPFACEYCDKRFSRKDKLDCHKRSIYLIITLQLTSGDRISRTTTL